MITKCLGLNKEVLESDDLIDVVVGCGREGHGLDCKYKVCSILDTVYLALGCHEKRMRGSKHKA